MVLAKSKNAVGLGNSLMNDRFGKGKKSNMHRGNAQPNGIKRTDQFGNEYITNEKKEADYVKMRSVTEQGALDEFLSTAELAGTDFTAEKMNNVKIIHTDQKNPYLLSKEEERGVMRKQNAKRARLTVPRRPQWDEHTSARELDEKERESLLEWRRGLAELQEVDDLLMTPFERNLEVWRQLWRVIERSDLVVQIVDARNPLLYRCEDLEQYVKELDGGKKRNLLLVNKADMMTLEQRRIWAEWFTERGIAFRFFSAELAKEMNEARAEQSTNAFGGLVDEADSDEDEDEDEDSEDVDESDIEEEIEPVDVIAKEAKKIQIQDEEEDSDHYTDEESVDVEPNAVPDSDPQHLSIEEQTRILTTDDLEALFLEHSPAATGPSEDGTATRKTNIGLVGYPNVGKSSTINALLGAKKVSVSATPGKTKHFQTIHLSERVLLCDCPGLVFPNFATTKAELVCAGVLPIDQLRESTGPSGLIAQRIPKHFLDALYGMKIIIRPIEEGGTGHPTGEEILRAYARARGFWTQGLGQPDESRAARTILKDYVKGKLLYCHPPPATPPIDGKHFNRELYDLAHLPQKRRAHLAASDVASLAGTENPSLMDDAESDILAMPQQTGRKGATLDKAFFGPGGGSGVAAQPFHYKYSEQGKQLTGRKLKTISALEKGVDLSEVNTLNSKKHNKANKRQQKKVRSAAVKDYDD
ncbi:Large subunit GTPase 1 [Fulvia fulva]|uniref:Large subunit GTPase 1 n=1 Tax=Passalora fulva TaxID=5499 RepID=A0A9Q8PAR4_PASFU|nr:Large subunit GTPase 1 [Fulvia fulva]KAK4621324.1 Large subunit GTPase 1 [Fulvia fulva]KAK4622606.1 Large subunit GTPase 1 [Fulvia fulva]UJO18976.1 Large subunit GTPase 1 [Fulvia fulva]WPV16296.1 Large subunit GTPase 1 [Fulvia fulva]WPV31564.1 Large subunit GTPase 1 [Fulvia fulva]